MQNTSQSSILSENLAYWTGRAAGYSEVNQTELATSQKEKWSRCLRSEISRRFPGIPRRSARIPEGQEFQGEFPVYETDDHITVLRLQRLVNHQDIAFVHTGVHHRIADDAPVKGRGGMADQHAVQVNTFVHVVLGRRRKSGMNSVLRHARQRSFGRGIFFRQGAQRKAG